MSQLDNQEKKQVESESIKCSSCGSNLKFDPKTQMLICQHCGRIESFEQELTASEIALTDALSTAETWDSESALIACENCGAKIVLDKSETAKCCPFCGTAHVVKVDEIIGIKPNAVLPFKITGEDALALSKKWAKKRWFAPREFKKKLSADNINGVYTPCFTFDSNTSSRYVARLGRTHTRTTGSGKNRRTYTYTEWFTVSGGCDYSFDDVTVTAGSKITQKNLDKIAPFDSNNSKAYENKFLLGFMSYHYEKDIETCWGEAKEKIDLMIKKNILSKYSYDKIDYIKVETNHTDVTYKYVLLPIYVGNYKFRKKVYGFIVNGTNGKVTGKTPISILKVLLVSVISVAVIGLLVWLLNTFV